MTTRGDGKKFLYKNSVGIRIFFQAVHMKLTKMDEMLKMLNIELTSALTVWGAA